MSKPRAPLAAPEDTGAFDLEVNRIGDMIDALTTKMETLSDQVILTNQTPQGLRRTLDGFFDLASDTTIIQDAIARLQKAFPTLSCDLIAESCHRSSGEDDEVETPDDESNADFQQPYRVEIEHPGCELCDSGRRWIVLGVVGFSRIHDNRIDAEEQASTLNAAFEAGRDAVLP
jgi:hypothetical protein